MKDHTIVDFSLEWRSDEEGVSNESGNFGMDSKFKFLFDSSPGFDSGEILSDNSIRSSFSDEKMKYSELTEEPNNSSDSRDKKASIQKIEDKNLFFLFFGLEH